MNTTGTVKGLQAPCGSIVDGETYEDQDDEVVLTRETFYSCGCQSFQHEYHDGSISRKIVRHDGRVLIDENLIPRNRRDAFPRRGACRRRRRRAACCHCHR